MDKGIIELDVGGTVFRTTLSTLCSVDGYFARMLQFGSWADGRDGAPIFIDRDSTAFAGILTYLRSGQVLVSDVEDDIYLERLLIEADFYQLTALSEGLKVELTKRKQIEVDKSKTGAIVQKIINAPDADRYFAIGWTFVGTYQGNETTSCSSSGSRVQALWRMNQCTACGETMSYEKFCKHITFFRPTMLVIQRIDKSASSASAIPTSDSLRDLDMAGLVFDSSFG